MQLLFSKLFFSNTFLSHGGSETERKTYIPIVTGYWIAVAGTFVLNTIIRFYFTKGYESGVLDNANNNPDFTFVAL